MQHEHAARGFVFLGARRLGQDFLAELVGEVFVLVLDLGEFVEQLADRGVARRLRGLAIEPRRLELERFGIFAHLGKPERTHQPERLVLDESFNVLAANQR